MKADFNLKNKMCFDKQIVLTFILSLYCIVQKDENG